MLIPLESTGSIKHVDLMRSRGLLVRCNVDWNVCGAPSFGMDPKARYRFKNRLTLSAKEALRRAGPAAPPWLDDEHKLVIERIFAEAEQRSVWTGIPFEVDHIIPLKGRCPHTFERNVCGLHVYWNLRVIPMQVNRSKSDFFETEWRDGGDRQRTSEEGDNDDDIPF